MFRSWLSPRVLTACGLLAACHALVLSLPTSATTKTRCEELREWASGYEGTSPTLDEIAKFDRPQRLAIFNAVSPDVRAELWQEQLRRFSQRPELSTTQRALIAEAMQLTTSKLYQRDQGVQEMFRHFWTRAEAAFTSAEHLRAWSDIGSVAPPSERRVDILRERQGLSSGAVGFPCQCNTGDPAPQCGQGVNCHNGGGCSLQGGCGSAGTKTCNGTCGS